MKPTADEGNEARSAKEVSNDREREETYLKKSQDDKSNSRRPCKGQQQFKTDGAYQPANNRNRADSSIAEAVIGPTGRDPESEEKSVEEKVSRDWEAGETYPRR